MAKWLSEDEIYVGDVVGNMVALRVGIVQVGRRVTVGLQRKETEGDQPDYTLDILALTHMEQALRKLRSELMKRTGGL